MFLLTDLHFLLGDPIEMFEQSFVVIESIHGAEQFGELHFVIEIMNPEMAESTDINAQLQLIF